MDALINLVITMVSGGYSNSIITMVLGGYLNLRTWTFEGWAGDREARRAFRTLRDPLPRQSFDPQNPRYLEHEVFGFNNPLSELL